MPNRNAIARRLSHQTSRVQKRPTYPGDNTAKGRKGDHIGTTELAQGSMLDQTLAALKRKRQPNEDEPGFDPTTMGNQKYRDARGNIRSGKTGGI